MHLKYYLTILSSLIEMFAFKLYFKKKKAKLVTYILYMSHSTTQHNRENAEKLYRPRKLPWHRK